MSSTTRYGFDTSTTVNMPWSTYVRARVMCSDGVVRPTVRISSTADTFFSVPCAVRVKGKTVAGFLTCETADGWSTDTAEDPAVIKFVAYSYGKNGNLLPGHGWKRACSHCGHPDGRFHGLQSAGAIDRKCSDCPDCK